MALASFYHDGRIVVDDKKLAKDLRLTKSKWINKIKPQLELIWTFEDGVMFWEHWTNEIRRSDRTRATAARAGSLGGKARAENAKAAVDQPQPEKRQSETKPEPSETPQLELVTEGPAPIKTAKAMAKIWNDVCGPVLPKVRDVTKARQVAFVRVFNGPIINSDMDVWQKFCIHITKTKFLTNGSDDRAWRASVDFVLKAQNMTKIAEGNFGQPFDPQVIDDNAAFEAVPTKPTGTSELLARRLDALTAQSRGTDLHHQRQG